MVDAHRLRWALNVLRPSREIRSPALNLDHRWRRFLKCPPLPYHVTVKRRSSSPGPSLTLTVRVDRGIYAAFEALCHARSLEAPHAIRALLGQVVQDGSLVRLLHTVDSDRGYMPYGLIKDMVLGMRWQPTRKGRPPRLPTSRSRENDEA